VVALEAMRVDRIEVGGAVRVRVDALPAQRFEGRVLKLETRPGGRGEGMRSGERRVAVISIENPDDKLKPGMTAVVEFED
jgi:hypothetical protein